MNKILEIDYVNQRAVVQPGLVNLHLSLAVGLPRAACCAPHPSSQVYMRESAAMSPKTRVGRIP